MATFCRNKVSHIEDMPSIEESSIVNPNIQYAPLFKNSQYKGDWSWQGKVEANTTPPSNLDFLFKLAGEKLGIDWRLIAAHAKCESNWNPAIGATSSSAAGLYQFIKSTWKANAPSGYQEPEHRLKPDIATYAYIKYMASCMNSFKNAVSFNDQVLLALQKYHDGNFKYVTTYAKYQVPQYLIDLDKKEKGKNKRVKEAREYTNKIMKAYQKMGGKV